MNRFLNAIKYDINQLVKMSKITSNNYSFLRFFSDILLLRIIRMLNLRSSNRERQICLRGGVQLTYRLNFGDVHSIREVWLDEAYKLPFYSKSGVLVDLGANIGLTSVWLAKRYQFKTVIAVEPSPENARLTRINLINNNIIADVIEAAIGPVDGTVYFEDNEASNQGKISSAGRKVQMLSMDSLLKTFPNVKYVDLIKMDIEGGEEELLNGDIDWLVHVRAFIAEFHPTIIDYPKAINILQNAGFTYMPAGSAHIDSMDSFVRQSQSKL